MPEHLAKRKNTHSVTGNTKSNATQDEIKMKENESGQKQCLVDGEDTKNDDAPSVSTPDANGLVDGEEEPKEPPRPPYDAMRVEPVLVNLIVEKYEGDVDENGFFEGDASIYFVGGHWYKGPIQNKKMNGQGVYCWSDGTMYKGDFSDNSIAGNGVYSWPDGSVYEGEVKNGLRHGAGTYKSGTCPSMYTGEWVNGMRHGKGVLYFDQDCETYYDGEWKYGIKSGYGVHKYKSGNYYKGQWCDNMRHGKGEMHWLNRGEEYNGEWVKGVQNGQGKHIWYSKRVAVSQYPIRNEYEGDFISGQRHGYGVFRYASGARYSGYWEKNVKSGRGEFMFKNGSIFKGMFENDHIVDYPNLVPSGMTTPEITESGLPVRSQTPLCHPASDTVSVDALLDINVRDIFIEERFDIERQHTELEEITRIVLRYMTPIKQIYKFYSKLGVFDSSDNAFIMVRMQFWRLLKDCMLHTLGPTLIEINFADGISETKGDCHDPSTQIYVRDFVNVLVNVSYLLFKGDFLDGDNCVIAKCMLKMLTKYILPNACIVKGNLFNKSDFTREALKYMAKCEEIFEYFRCMTSKNDLRKALRIRDFLWMLKDFKLINSSLTVKKFLNAVYKDDPLKLEGRCFNLDNSVVFLEFFEALLDCSKNFRSESSKCEDESESVKNTMADTLDFKSPSLTKDDEESINADAFFEQQKSPVSASSPDKSVIFPEAGSSMDTVKNEPPQSPSKTSDFTSFGKSSTVGGSRRDQQAGREGGSINGGSRNRRRGTSDNVEVDSKFGTTTSSKSKGTKEKEKSGKSGGKSAKKVTIDDVKEKNVTTTASVSFDVEQDQERLSVVQLEKTPPATDQSSVKRNSIKQTDGEDSLAMDQIISNVQEDLGQVNDESLEHLVEDIHPNSIVETIDNTIAESKLDRSGEELQNWISNLQIFFEDNFFPAFELQKDINRAQNTKKT